MSMNKRTQRTRKTKPGIPVGSKYVGRPSKWGNRWKVGSNEIADGTTISIPNNRVAVMMYYAQIKDMIESSPETFKRWLKPLRGKNLCCWCKPDEICHADVLLFFTNRFQAIGSYAKKMPNFDVFESWLKAEKSVV